MRTLLQDIFQEVDRAEGLFPEWPDDLIHAAAIVGEEAGELLQAALDFVYHCGLHEQVHTEAIHVAAMAIRLLKHL